MSKNVNGFGLPSILVLEEQIEAKKVEIKKAKQELKELKKELRWKQYKQTMM